MAKDTDKAQRRAGGNVPGPDVMLGLWASWMDRMAAPGQAAPGQEQPWWRRTADAPAPDALAGGVKHLEDLQNDPTLRSIDQMWNANPLREVIPIDWAEIVRALRTVWLRSMLHGTAATAAAEMNAAAWTSALNAWNEAGRLWWGGGDSAATGKPAVAANKR